MRAELLRILFADAKRERFVRELAREGTFSLRTVQLELSRLSAADLVTSRSDGYHRFYRANRQHPLFVILQHLVIKGASDWAFVSYRKRPRSGRRGPRRRRLRQPFRMSIGLKAPE